MEPNHCSVEPGNDMRPGRPTAAATSGSSLAAVLPERGHEVPLVFASRGMADAGSTVVLADPEGNEFCVLGPLAGQT